MNFKYILTFIAGAAIGGTVSWKLAKKKYSFEESLDDIKDAYDSHEEAAEDLKSRHAKPDISEYASKIEEEEYSSEEPKNEVKPHVISSEEFAELSDYSTATLYFYNDGYIVDENEDVLSKDDIEDYVGLENIQKLGDTEDEVLYVRNDVRHTDFEVILEDSNWEDIPHPDRLEVK